MSSRKFIQYCCFPRELPRFVRQSKNVLELRGTTTIINSGDNELMLNTCLTFLMMCGLIAQLIRSDFKIKKNYTMKRQKIQPICIIPDLPMS